MVAVSHLDTQWQWTLRDTIGRHLPKTLRQNFSRFAKFPSYVLSFDGAFRYQLMAEYYPAEFEQLKQWVRAGRWAPVGALLDAADVNIPSPESLFRQVLYGNRWFGRELGVTCCELFLPDCFGFSFALPSVAAHCGLKGFSSQKLSKGRAAAELFALGRWFGPDGGSVSPLGWRIRRLLRIARPRLESRAHAKAQRRHACGAAITRWRHRWCADGPPAPGSRYGGRGCG